VKLFIKVFISVFVLLIFSIFTSKAEAITPTPTPDPCAKTSGTQGAPASVQDADFTTDPSPCITEADPVVKIKFHGLLEGGKYTICLKSEDCVKKDGVKFTFDSIEIFKDIANRTKTATDGTVEFTICGDGKDKVKLSCPEKDSGKNYFWGGNIYAVSIGTFAKEGDSLFYKPEKIGAFYVARSFPQAVTVDPNQNVTKDQTIKVTIPNDAWRPGGWRRNNYQIMMNGGYAYSKGGCVAFPADNSPTKNITFDKLQVGRYTITIREQVNDGDLDDAIWIGTPSNFTAGDNPKGCEGGFTYYQIICEVRDSGRTGGTCSKPKESRDPKGEEYRAFLSALNELNDAQPGIAFPCGDGTVKGSPTECGEIKTGIGPIKITPQGFIETLFRFVLMIASFGGIIIIIYAGYVFMTSRGDKEKIAGARETLTAAIVGLLFIVLSIVILEIIGVDILQIPGIELDQP
jgi:hypothetical protein